MIRCGKIRLRPLIPHLKERFAEIRSSYQVRENSACVVNRGRSHARFRIDGGAEMDEEGPLCVGFFR